MVIIIPVPREPAENLAKTLFKMMLVCIGITGFFMFIIGIISLIDGDISGGLPLLAIGLVISISTSLWMYFKIKATIERNERFFTSKSVIGLAISGIFVTMIGVILLTYGDLYLTVGILVTIGSAGFFIPGIIRVIQKLRQKQIKENQEIKTTSSEFQQID